MSLCVLVFVLTISSLVFNYFVYVSILVLSCLHISYNGLIWGWVSPNEHRRSLVYTE